MPLPLGMVIETLDRLELAPIEHFSDALDNEILVRTGFASLTQAERMTFRGMILQRMLRQFIDDSTDGREQAIHNFTRELQKGN